MGYRMKKHLLMLALSIVLLGLSCSTALARDRRHRGPSWCDFWEDHDDDRYDDDHDGEYHGRRFYKAQRISKREAKEIVSETFPHWHVGDGWERRKKRRVELIVPLMYRGQIIGDIKINPTTGKILSEGVKHSERRAIISLEQARNTVQQALPRMKVGKKVRIGKHGNFWEVPLMFMGEEVEEIKVGTGSGNILPDLHIAEDSYRYRRRIPPIFRRQHERDID